MTKKNSAVIRIIAWSVVLVLLIGMLVMGLTGHFSFASFNLSGTHYKDADKYTVLDGRAALDQKTYALEVNWIGGDVHIKTYSGDKVLIEEKYNGTLDDKEKAHYYNDGKCLYIQPSASKGFSPFSFFNNVDNKDLTIRIPESSGLTMQSLMLDTVSSNGDISGFNVKKLSINNVSGNFKLKDTLAEDLNLDTVSGDYTAKGNFAKINADSVSGNIKISSEICPDEVIADSVSGDLVLAIPSNNGFTLTRDSVSGSVSNDFDIRQRGEDTYIHKAGNSFFRFDTVSGNLSIRKISVSEKNNNL